MMKEDFLVRSSAAQYASAVFYQNYNDVDIYIEDSAEGYTKIFSNLLNRALSTNQIQLDKVFPLGGRKNIYEYAKKDLEQVKNGIDRKSIFIMDGDLNLLTGERNQQLANIIILPRYCIENFLLDFDAWTKLMDEESSDKTYDKLKEEADFENWMKCSNSPLRELFLIFAVNHYLEGGIQTVARGHNAICKNSFGDIDVKKTADLVQEIREELNSLKSKEEVDRILSFINSKVNNDVCFLRTYVSGKDFLLPLLFCRFRQVTKSRASKINLINRLSMAVSIEPLQELANRIKQIVSS